MTFCTRLFAWCIPFALGGLAATASAQSDAPEAASGWSDKRPVTSRRFMVAAANPLAVRAGYDILRAGGTAMDAAVAVQMVLGLVEPQSSGLGGGAFILYHDAKHKRLAVIDGRETAPAAARADQFLDENGKPIAFRQAMIGGKSVGVPGVLKALEAGHRRYGRLPWNRLFASATSLAERGFPVSPRLHTLLAAERNMRQSRVRGYFFDADGNAWPVGMRLRNPAYAKTLRAIARGGAKAFYEGDIADDIVRTVASAASPGDLTRDDLARYEVKMREPVCGVYRSYRICGVPPPSSGALTVLQMLKILERYDVASMRPASFWSVHFISEAGRLAYADRDVYEADPDFVRIPDGLLDDRYLEARAQLLLPTSSMGRASAGTPPSRTPEAKVAFGVGQAAELASTSQVSIVDGYGNALSMTTSIEAAFGSRLMTEGGFLLNNELTDFSFVPLQDGKPVANRVEPGKRPRSAMAPTIVYDRAGRVFIVTGSPGGPAIINYVAKTLIALIDWKLDPQAASALPNFGSRNGPTELEKDTPVAALEERLRAIGHDIRVSEQTSGVQTIMRTRDGWIGGADPRREGIVLGD
jgi:gamma-glutamyltranspeptidase/glutathione hydrolase